MLEVLVCETGGGSSTGEGARLGAADGPRDKAKDLNGPRKGEPEGVNTLEGAPGFGS